MGGDKGTLNTLEKLETARDAAAEELAKLLDVQATGETTEPGKQALINAANRLDSKQWQVEAVSHLLDTTMLRQKETVNLAVFAAVQAATSGLPRNQDQPKPAPILYSGRSSTSP